MAPLDMSLTYDLESNMVGPMSELLIWLNFFDILDEADPRDIQISLIRPLDAQNQIA